jgi:hypothetical protein
MKMVLFLEAGQPGGSIYRIGFGCLLPLELLSIVMLFVRLFYLGNGVPFYRCRQYEPDDKNGEGEGAR